jgi:DNA-binding GntR family transcriptional regulator
MRLQLIEARRMVEVPIAEIAATYATQDQINPWCDVFDDYVRFIDDFSDKRYLAAHKEFHLALARMTRNTIQVMLVETLLQSIPQTLREREFAFPHDLDLQQLRHDQVTIHRAILEAVADHNSLDAGKAMTLHTDFERDLVLQVYHENP